MSNLSCRLPWKQDGSGQFPNAISARLIVLDSNGNNEVSRVTYPLSEPFDLNLDPGTYVFKFEVLDTIDIGSMSISISDNVSGNILWAPGFAINSNNSSITSQAVSISSAFNSFQPYLSSDFTSTAASNNFQVSYSLERCEGNSPVTRRAYFTFNNYSTPMSFSVDNVNFLVFNPNNFFRSAEVGTTVSFYFKNADNTVVQQDVTFTACSTPPQSAPGVSSTAIEQGENVTVTFGTSGTLKVRKNGATVNTITNATSPYTWNSQSLGPGSYTFSITDTNGESAQSTPVVVESGDSGDALCNFTHKQLISQWSPGEGPYPFVAVKFSNSGVSPWLGQKVSDVPFIFRIRGRDMILDNNMQLEAGINASAINCFAGAATGVYEPPGFPMPPGYTRNSQGIYQPGDTPTYDVETRRVKAVVDNSCFATSFQIGVSSSYASEAPAVSTVDTWIDGLEIDIQRVSGAYPWVFVRDKANPSNVSPPTKTLIPV